MHIGVGWDLGMGGTEGNPKLSCPAFSNLLGLGGPTVLVCVVSLLTLISFSGGSCALPWPLLLPTLPLHQQCLVCVTLREGWGNQLRLVL